MGPMVVPTLALWNLLGSPCQDKQLAGDLTGRCLGHPFLRKVRPLYLPTSLWHLFLPWWWWVGGSGDLDHACRLSALQTTGLKSCGEESEVRLKTRQDPWAPQNKNQVRGFTFFSFEGGSGWVRRTLRGTTGNRKFIRKVANALTDTKKGRQFRSGATPPETGSTAESLKEEISLNGIRSGRESHCKPL